MQDRGSPVGGLGPDLYADHPHVRRDALAIGEPGTAPVHRRAGDQRPASPEILHAESVVVSGEQNVSLAHRLLAQRLPSADVVGQPAAL